jgi:hypothetical protein
MGACFDVSGDKKMFTACPLDAFGFNIAPLFPEVLNDA